MNSDFPSYKRAERFPTETAGLDFTFSVGIEDLHCREEKKENPYSGRGRMNKVNTGLSKEELISEFEMFSFYQK